MHIAHAQCQGIHQKCWGFRGNTTPFSSSNLSHKKKTKMQRNPIRIDDVELTKWFFGLAQIFGHWSLTNTISNYRQMDSKKLAIRNSVWFAITFFIQLAWTWHEINQYYYAMVHLSTIRRVVGFLTLTTYTMCSESNFLIAIWNRQNLYEILSINQAFERTVSYPFFEYQ